MSVHAGSSSHEVGSASFLGSFFSTVFLRLESARWGSRFPAIMRDLYAGTLPSESCDAALRELAVIRRELAELSPDQVVWDHEHPAAKPPWGTNVSPHIRNLAQYFVTSAGQPLLDILEQALQEGTQQGMAVRVE